MEEEEEGGWVSEGGSWKGLLCSFIGSTITNIPSVNLAVQHNTNDDALALELRLFILFYFFGVCMRACMCGVFEEVFTAVHGYMQLLESLHS